MSQSVFTKTVQTEPQAIRVTFESDVDKSSEIAVGTALHIKLCIDYAPDEDTAPTDPPQFLIQQSFKDSGHDTWRDLDVIEPDIASASVDTALTGTINAGATSVSMASGSATYLRGSVAFIKNGTLANSEWVRVAENDTGTVVELVDALTNAQTGAVIRSQAQHFVKEYDCRGVKRMRVVAHNNIESAGTLRDFVWRVSAILTTQIGS